MPTTLPAHLVASPGSILDEWLEERAMSQRELADRMSKSTKFISQLVTGKATLTADTAHDLELVTGVTSETWLRMEATYRAALKAQDALATAEASESPIDAHLVAMLRRLGVVTAPPRQRGAQNIEIYRFLGVSSRAGLATLAGRRATAFRTSTAFTPDPIATEVVLAFARRQASPIKTRPFDPASLRNALEELRSLSVPAPAEGIEAARNVLATSGVALVFVPNIPKAHCNGVTMWFGDHVIVAITDRGKREDAFWFTLFHELSHALETQREAIYLDHSSATDSRSPAEIRADAFATAQLVPAGKAHLLETIESFDDLKRVAGALGISPGVVVGQLHHRRLKPYSWGRAFIRRVEIAMHES